MSTNKTDQQIIELLEGKQLNSIDDVISVMQEIDRLLPGDDGLKWFNLLYLMVTREILIRPPVNGWQAPEWTIHLDIVFAESHFLTIRKFLQHSAPIPHSWRALFEVRDELRIERIQFALAGMNAHINHDLSLALIRTCDDLQTSLDMDSRAYSDYEHINEILDAVLPVALNELADGRIIGEIAQNSGTLGRLLAMWNVREARMLAWVFADHVKKLPVPVREIALRSQDRLTGVIGRSILSRLEIES